MHHLDDAIGNASVSEQVHNHLADQRVGLRRLLHDGIARRQSRNHVLDAKLEREVPGEDEPGDAEWFVVDTRLGADEERRADFDA